MTVTRIQVAADLISPDHPKGDDMNADTIRAATPVIGAGLSVVSERPPLNTSGLAPMDLRVLVLPDAAEKVTAGGIILPEAATDQKRMAMMFGTLVAVGENAWEEAAARSPSFTRPQPGDRVVFAKYGGVVIEGRDKREYRIMNDEDVIGREMTE